MVLFYEDEKKLKPEPTKLRRRVRLALIILVVMACFFGVGLVILSAMGGSGETLRLGAQDYLRQATGLEPNIGQLDNVTFFPEVSISMKDITFKKIDGDDNVASVGSFDFSMSFWDVLFARRRIRSLEVQKIHIDAGVMVLRTLDVERMGIDLSKENSGFARLLMRGRYGADPFHATLALAERDLKGGKKSFQRRKKSDFLIDFPFVNLKGFISPMRGGGIQINITALGAPEKILSGQVNVRHKSNGLNVVATMKGGASTLVADMRMKKDRIDGGINAPVFDLKDVGRYMALRDIYSDFAIPDDQIDFSDRNMYVEISVKKIKLDGHDLGAVRLPMHVADNALKIGPLEGEVSGGILRGTVAINAAVDPATFTMKGGIKNWHYAQISNAVAEGTADVVISLDGEAKNWMALWGSLNGEAVLVAGAGELASGMIDFWGGGLLNTMLPDISSDDKMKLNCAIADLKVKNGIAKPDPFFIDTGRVTVVGDGEINIPEQSISLRLSPKTKKISAGTLTSVPVRISGSLSKPSIGPDTMGLGTKIGGLLLGAVNPAFLVFSMTDLGLTENHPCYEFIGKPQSEDKLEVKQGQ